MKKREQSDYTKAALLDAAEVQFARSGFNSTSVLSICEAAGVSKGAFYHHFESKQSLFFELLQRWLRNLEAALVQIEARAEEVPDKLLSMASIVGDVIEVGGPQLPIYLEFWNQALHDPAVHRALSTPFQEFLEFFASLLKQGIQRGVVRNTDEDRSARVVTGLAIGLLFQGLLEPEAEDWNAVTTFGLTMLFEGMLTEAAE